MKYCKNCDLKIDGNQEKCLFCGGTLEHIDDNTSSAFSTVKPKNYYIERAKKYVAFGLFVLFAVSVMLELYLFKGYHFWILTGFSCVYAYLITDYSIRNDKCVVGKMFIMSLLTSLETIGVFWFLRFSLGIDLIYLYWTFVYPGIIIVNFLMMLIVEIAQRGKKFHDNLIYIFINGLWGLSPLFLILLKKVEIQYVNTSCIVISLLVALWFLLFSGKKTKDELARRFHI